MMLLNFQVYTRASANWIAHDHGFLARETHWEELDLGQIMVR